MSIFMKIRIFAKKTKTQMNRIYNIIFDLGGVIYDIRYENIADAFVRHGVTNLGNFFSRSFQTNEMDLFEEGKMSEASFRDYVRHITQAPLTDTEIDEIINAILIDIPAHRIALLLALRKKYRVYLYSNTNETNYKCYTEGMKRKFGFDVFSECFDHAYFSHLMGIRKPALEGFQLIVSDNGLRPEETVFIDDNMPNVEAALRAGIHGCYLDPAHDVGTLFDEGFNFRTALMQG